MNKLFDYAQRYIKGMSVRDMAALKFCLCAVGAAGNSLGGPLGTLFAAIVASVIHHSMPDVASRRTLTLAGSNSSAMPG